MKRENKKRFLGVEKKPQISAVSPLKNNRVAPTRFPALGTTAQASPCEKKNQRRETSAVVSEATKICLKSKLFHMKTSVRSAVTPDGLKLTALAAKT